MHRLPFTPLLSVSCAVLLVAIAPAGLAAQDRKADTNEPPRVPKILKAEYQIQEKHPPSLVVTAIGQVPTGGYTDVRLIRVKHEQPPKDGIQDYRLVAAPPTGPAIQVISEVKASDTWENSPSWIKGIRILGKGDGVKITLFNKPD